MQTKLTLNLDEQTAKMAEDLARIRGISLDEFLRTYLPKFLHNELTLNKFSAKNSTQNENSETTKWSDLEQFLNTNRLDLPQDFTFNRNELLVSEDMQHCQIIENTLQIVNPFIAE